MNVEKLMSGAVYTCSERDALDVPARIMWQKDVGVVPVVDEQQRLVGIVTDRDVAMAAVLRGRPLQQIRVADTMSRNLVTAAPGDDIHLVEAAMAAAQVRRVPVVDSDKRVIGLLSLNDLASAYKDGKSSPVPAPELAQTLAAVSRRRGPVAAAT